MLELQTSFKTEADSIHPHCLVADRLVRMLKGPYLVKQGQAPESNRPEWPEISCPDSAQITISVWFVIT